MARNKQEGPELKLYEIDTMQYLTRKNIAYGVTALVEFARKNCLSIANEIGLSVGKAMERFKECFNPADIANGTATGSAYDTWLRKNGLLNSQEGCYQLSELGQALSSAKITDREYCFLLLSKQWIKITDVGSQIEYKRNLLAFLFEKMRNVGSIPEGTFVSTIGQNALDLFNAQYQSLKISNSEAARFLVDPLKIAEIIDLENGNVVLHKGIVSIVDDFLANEGKLKSPSHVGCVEERFWNAMDHGVYDLISDDNRLLYSKVYPNLFKKKSLFNMNLIKQQIFFGAPGTGKSHEIKKQTAGQSVVRTTFHPDSDYSTFVGAYKPTTKKIPVTTVIGTKAVPVEDSQGNAVVENKIVYEFVAQAFLLAYVNAWTLLVENKPQFLIIEEINRGNCAQIFGDLFQLLDRNDFGFSDYPITADKDLQKHLKKAFENLNVSGADIEGEYEESNDSIAVKVKSGEVLLLPKNLYIWATMNTSDQSLFPIDSAFKRRWDWKYIPIDTKKENWSIKVNGSAYSWSDFLEKINEKIGSTTSSEDKKLGFYFCKACKNEISADRFVSKVLFYIYNDVFKDYGYEDPMFKNEGKVMPFQSFYNTDGSVNETVVKIILDNLDVVRDLEVDLPEDDFQKMDSSKFNEVVFSDGTIIKGKTQFETYQNTLEKIGIEKVAEIVAEKRWHRKSSLVVDSVQHDDIVNSKDFSYVQIDHYYVIKGVNTKSMMGYLKVINEKLDLGLKVQ